jgi:hypothetical protein
VYSLSIEFDQNVLLERNKLSMRAVTWNLGAVGYIPINEINSKKGYNGLVDGLQTHTSR